MTPPPSNQTIDDLARNLTPEQAKTLYYQIALSKNVAEGVTPQMKEALTQRQEVANKVLDDQYELRPKVVEDIAESNSNATAAQGIAVIEVASGILDSVMSVVGLVPGLGKVEAAYKAGKGAGGLISDVIDDDNEKAAVDGAKLAANASKVAGLTNLGKDVDAVAQGLALGKAIDDGDTTKIAIEGVGALGKVLDNKYVGAGKGVVEGGVNLSKGLDHFNESTELKANNEKTGNSTLGMIDATIDKQNTKLNTISELQSRVAYGSDPKILELMDAIEKSHPNVVTPELKEQVNVETQNQRNQLVEQVKHSRIPEVQEQIKQYSTPPAELNPQPDIQSDFQNEPGENLEPVSSDVLEGVGPIKLNNPAFTNIPEDFAETGDLSGNVNPEQTDQPISDLSYQMEDVLEASNELQWTSTQSEETTGGWEENIYDDFQGEWGIDEYSPYDYLEETDSQEWSDIEDFSGDEYFPYDYLDETDMDLGGWNDFEDYSGDEYQYEEEDYDFDNETFDYDNDSDVPYDFMDDESFYDYADWNSTGEESEDDSYLNNYEPYVYDEYDPYGNVYDYYYDTDTEEDEEIEAYGDEVISDEGELGLGEETAVDDTITRPEDYWESGDGSLDWSSTEDTTGEFGETLEDDGTGIENFLEGSESEFDVNSPENMLGEVEEGDTIGIENYMEAGEGELEWNSAENLLGEVDEGDITGIENYVEGGDGELDWNSPESLVEEGDEEFDVYEYEDTWDPYGESDDETDALVSGEFVSDELTSAELISDEIMSGEFASEEFVSEEVVSDELFSDDFESEYNYEDDGYAVDEEGWESYSSDDYTADTEDYYTEEGEYELSDELESYDSDIIDYSEGIESEWESETSVGDDSGESIIGGMEEYDEDYSADTVDTGWDSYSDNDYSYDIESADDSEDSFDYNWDANAFNDFGNDPDYSSNDSSDYSSNDSSDYSSDDSSGSIVDGWFDTETTDSIDSSDTYNSSEESSWDTYTGDEYGNYDTSYEQESWDSYSDDDYSYSDTYYEDYSSDDSDVDWNDYSYGSSDSYDSGYSYESDYSEDSSDYSEDSYETESYDSYESSGDYSSDSSEGYYEEEPRTDYSSGSDDGSANAVEA